MIHIYTFRKATLQDLDALVQLREDFITGYGPLSDKSRAALANYRGFLQDVMAEGSFVLWLAELDGEIAACGSVNFYRLPPIHLRPNGREGYIGNMFTYPAHRRQGLAKRILQLLVDDARAAGCTMITLNASEDGRPLYEAFGFENSSRMMRISL